MTGSVCRRAVHLRGVFPREGTAAVCSFTAVGVNDDFPSGQTGVSVWSSDDEYACRVDVVLDFVMEECKHFLAVYLFLHPRDEDVDDIVLDDFQHRFLVLVEIIVLRGDDDGVYALRYALVRIFDRHLALGVGAQVGHDLSLFPYLGQRAHDEVRQVQRDGHVVLGLVGGVAEHHSLVAGTLVFLIAAVNATADVAALFVDGGKDAAAVAVELVFRLCVANLIDGFSRDGLKVDIGFGAHLSHDDHLSGGYKRLDSRAGTVVVGKKLVEQCVAYLVGYFVGMPFRNGF